MKAYDVQKAVRHLRTDGFVAPPAGSTLTSDIFDDHFLVRALETVLPILEWLAAKASRRKFWLRWGINVLVKALKGYLTGLKEEDKP
jgi:hypothetical protein